MRRLVSLTVGSLFAFMPAVAATAQTICGNHGEIVSRLESQFAENRVGVGLSSSGRLIEVFASPEGNWSILVTLPPDVACLVDFGEAWQSVPVRTADKPHLTN